MTPTQAQTSIKNLNSELFNLTPSAIIELFEIQFDNLFYDEELLTSGKIDTFRFHNNLKLVQNDIIWQGKVYTAAPIQTEGFEFNSQGTVANPKIRISVTDSGILELNRLKQVLRSLGDLTGAVFRRKKTYAKFLDSANWLDPKDIPPGFSADPNVEARQEVYVFNRKTADDKNVLEYELTSIFDLKGIRLPARVVTSERCVWQYRGEGCLYEYDNPNDEAFQRRETSIHGSTSTLPVSAPPKANFKDELLSGDILPTNIPLNDKGAFQESIEYQVGDVFYVTKNGIKYYFVVKRTPTPGTLPPNSLYYEADECSKTINGCRMRWNSINSLGAKVLPFGGFLAVNKIG